MTKKFLSTFLGIVLSFLIAVGGWVLISQLFAKSEEALFEKHGIVNDAVPEYSESGSIERQHLSESEMAAVLSNWNGAGNAWPHDPAGGQINMEKAIEIAEGGLSYINMQEILPTDFYKSINIEAKLFQNRVAGHENEELAPEYSYWSITLFSHHESTNEMTIFFKINAVTGQIWEVSIRTFFMDGNDKQANSLTDPTQMVSAFADYLNFGGGEMHSDDDHATLSYANDQLYASASRQWNHSDKGKTYLSIHIRLSANPN